ncbi:MAG: hypothetical protein PWP16_1323 [Eubacteriaceae bacterium]|jgi:hypothetical protein|nr:hypothetical protein [Eubacteriaceae bacterium]
MSKKAGKLELGSEISLGGRIWIAKRKSEPAEIVTLALKTSLKNMEFDEAEPGNPDEWRADYGNNDYELSNIRQWLNSRGNDWFRKQHEYDAPPEDYEYTNGFLTDFTEKELDAIKKLENGDLFYLPSVDEVDLVTGDEFDKGWVWTRTPYSGSSYFVRGVSSTGALLDNYAFNGNFGVRPLCSLSSETKLTKVDDAWQIIDQKKTEKKKKNKRSKKQQQDEILRKVIAKWGMKLQSIKAIEEMSELTKELSKVMLDQDQSNNENILEEMADVQIMLNQLAIIYGSPEGWIKKKINRMKNKFQEEESEWS